MRQVLKMSVILILLIYGGMMLIQHIKINDDDLLSTVPKLKSEQKEKQIINYVNGDIYSWIDESKDKLINEYGDPHDKHLSAYNYTWWIYYINDEYIQFGIKDDKIVTIYTTGDSISIEPFKIGESYQKMNEEYHFKHELTYKDDLSFYTFIL